MNKKLEELYLKYINERLLSNSLNNNILSIDEIKGFTEGYNLVKIITDDEISNLRNKYLNKNTDLIILSRKEDNNITYFITKDKSLKLEKEEINGNIYYDQIEIREYNEKYNVYLKHNLNIKDVNANIIKYTINSQKRIYSDFYNKESFLDFNDQNKKYKEENKKFYVNIFKENIINQLNYFLNNNNTNIFRYEKKSFKYDLTTLKENINSEYKDLDLKEMKTILNNLKKYQQEGYRTKESDKKIMKLREEIKNRKYTN